MKRIYLEITNACNLNCPFCTNSKGNSFLSYEDIKSHLTEIKAVCNYIYLHILGEPLLHPHFNDILNLLDEMDFNLQLVTNGTLLYKYPDLLDHKCLRKLSVSIHSVNNIPVNDSYFTTLESLISSNINKTIELRFYDRESLDEKIQSFLNKLHQTYKVTDTSKKDSYKLKENVYIYFQELFRWPDINDEVISYVGTCHGGTDMLAINSNSDVTLCCLDPYAHNYLGNLKENSLKEIMSSEKYLNIISNLKNRKITTELCSKCSYRLRFDKKLLKE